MQSIVTESRSKVTREQDNELQRGSRKIFLLGGGDKYVILIMVITVCISQVYTYVKTYQIWTLKYYTAIITQ